LASSTTLIAVHKSFIRCGDQVLCYVACPMPLEATACAAAAIAAADLGYSGFAEIIRERQLSPAAVAHLLQRHGAAKDGMIVAIIVLAGATARHHADPHDWNGDLERQIALEALTNKSAFERAASRAAKIVAEHWPEITAEA
jgi:hypothetical protein